MTTQIPENTIGITEMKGAFERHIGNLILQNLNLEKRIAFLETSIAQLQAEIVDLRPFLSTMSREAAEIAEGDGTIIRGE